MKFISALKERRFVQYLTAYAASGWLVLEAIDQMAGNGVIPRYLYPIALTLLIAGLPAVAIVSWFYGAPGDQRPPPGKRAFLGIAVIGALAATGFVARDQLAGLDKAALAAIDRLEPTNDPRRIAVLYFDAAGASERAGLLAAGLTESLIDALSEVPAIHVVSRNGVAPLRGRASFPSDSVARALQVGTFVQGRVAESDSIVRVRVDVVDAMEDRNIRSNTFERPRSELFALQDDIAEEVALFLRETVGAEVRLIGAAPEAENVEAWMLVQSAAEETTQAGQLMALDDPEGADRLVARADSLLARAQSLAPAWPVPPTRRGWLSYQRARWAGFDRDALPPLLDAAVDHANRALALEPREADALELRATVKYWRFLVNLTSEPGEADRLLQEAEDDFNASIEADPSQASAMASLSHLLMNRGAIPQAKLMAERAYEADPWLLNANLTLWRLFQASLDLQDAQEARKWCDVGASRFPSDFRFHECRVWLYVLPGQEPDSVRAHVADLWAQCDAVVELSPSSRRDFNRSRCHMVLAMGLVRADLPDSARAVARAARAGVEVDPIRELAWFESFVHAWLGDADAAIDRLSLYLAANPNAAESFARDETWWLADLRSNPRYQRLIGAQ